MINDIRIAFRNLTRVPGFAVAFVLTLGLGIGANTAIFSVINGVLLRPLPYPEAERMMHLTQPQVAAGVDDSSFSFPEVADYRSLSKTMDQFVEFGDWTFNVLGRGEPRDAGQVPERDADVVDHETPRSWIISRSLQAATEPDSKNAVTC